MNNKAFFFALLTALIWGCAPAIEKIGLSGKLDPYLAVIIRTIPIMIVAPLGLVVMGRPGMLSSIDLRSAVYLGIGGLIAGLAGQLTFYSALKAGEASVVVPVTATFPLVALIVSVLVLGEAFTWQKLAGITLVVFGVMLLR